MSSISERLKVIRKETSDYQYTLVAATKYVTSNEMIELYKNGIKDFGENRVESFLEKYADLEKYDIKWHFIGTLQTRKVKDIIDKIDILHSVDRYSLIDEINKRTDRTIDCFIQFNISSEESKSGFTENDIPNIIEKIKNSNLNVIGLMGMASNTEDDELLKKQFLDLQKYSKIFYNNGVTNCKNLSMGMSNDYIIALECGATHIRLGSTLFR